MRSTVYAALACALIFPAVGQARDMGPRFVPLGAEVEAPRGYAEMCANDAALCHRFRPKAPAPSAPADPGPSPSQDTRLLALILAPAPRFHGPSQAAPAFAVPLAAFASADPASYRFSPLSMAANFEHAPRPGLAHDLATIALGANHPFRAPPRPASAPSAERLALLRQPTAATAQPPLPDHLADQPLSGPSPEAGSQAGDEAALMKLLKGINGHVNARVFQQSDSVIYGRPEVWRPSGDGRNAMGDCEDIALEKRVELLAHDFPPERLFMAVVFSRSAGLHAVLVARMAGGDLVLDSRVNYITGWHDSGYEWLSVESPQDPDRWFAPA